MSHTDIKRPNNTSPSMGRVLRSREYPVHQHQIREVTDKNGVKHKVVYPITYRKPPR